jgi:methyl-accepting chemotaxis protein
MKVLRVLKRMFVNSDRSTQLLAEIRDGVANMANDLNRRLSEMVAQQADQAQRAEQRLAEIREGVANLAESVNQARRADKQLTEFRQEMSGLARKIDQVDRKLLDHAWQGND